MEVVSTNIGKRREVTWKGKKVVTGIYKKPVEGPVFLGTEDVDHDHVDDRKYHGGIDKACYLYSEDHYPFWKLKYPDLDWNYGMMGENLTIKGMEEQSIYIDDIYELGQAIIQVTQPRQPCSKLGIRFGTQAILKEFISAGLPGIYVKVLTPGTVEKGDRLRLVLAGKDKVSVTEVFHSLYYGAKKDSHFLESMVRTDCLPEGIKEDIIRKAI